MGRNRIKKPPYTHGFITRHGKPYFRFRREGFKSVPLPGLPWSPEFMAAYEAAMSGASKIELGASRTRPGTIAAMVAGYYRHELWLNLSPASHNMRRPILERFRAEHGDKRVALLQPHHIAKLLETKKRFAKRNWRKTIRGLMAYCLAENHIKTDPTDEVKLAKIGKTIGHMTWLEDQIEQYRKAHPLGTMPRLAIELLLNLAARRNDARQIGRQHMRQGYIQWRPKKTLHSTGKILTIRITREFQAALDAMPASDSLTFLTTERSKPFKSEASFGNKFARWCIDAGLKPVLCDDGKIRNFRAHGLRKAACRHLAHAGCTAPEIMAISGHSTLSQVQVYIDEVEQERMAKNAMTKLEDMDRTATLVGKP